MKRIGLASCPACGGAHFDETELIPHQLRVQTCLECGLQINCSPPVGTAGYERLDAQAYERSIGLVRRRQAKDILGFVLRHRPGTGAWLDVGCGTGNLLWEAQRAGYRVLGVEPDALAYQQACALVGAEHVRQGRMDAAAAPDGSFDVISTLDVLEHIPPVQVPDFARLVAVKLKPHGLWVIKVPSQDGLYFQAAHRLARCLGRPLHNVLRRLWLLDYQAPHAMYFSQVSLARYLQRGGWRVVSHHYLDEIPNGTAIDRMRVDPAISKFQAFLFAPGFYLVNFIERLRGQSDALVQLAERGPEA